MAAFSGGANEIQQAHGNTCVLYIAGLRLHHQTIGKRERSCVHHLCSLSYVRAAAQKNRLKASNDLKNAANTSNTRFQRVEYKISSSSSLLLTPIARLSKAQETERKGAIYLCFDCHLSILTTRSKIHLHSKESCVDAGWND